MGGGHTFHVSLLYPTKFDYYGLFSAGLHLAKGGYQDSFADQIKANPEFESQSARLFGSKPKLYWMGMGKTDFLYQSTVDLRAYWEDRRWSHLAQLAYLSHVVRPEDLQVRQINPRPTFERGFFLKGF